MLARSGLAPRLFGFRYIPRRRQAGAALGGALLRGVTLVMKMGPRSQEETRLPTGSIGI